jgi:hypothetical protein
MENEREQMEVPRASGALGCVAIYRGNDSGGDVVLGGSHAFRVGHFPFDVGYSGTGVVRACIGATQALAPCRLCDLRRHIFSFGHTRTPEY